MRGTRFLIFTSLFVSLAVSGCARRGPIASKIASIRKAKAREAKGQAPEDQQGDSTSVFPVSAEPTVTFHRDFTQGVDADDWNIWLIPIAKGQHPGRDLRIPKSQWARHFLDNSRSFQSVPEGLKFTVHAGDHVVRGDYLRNKERCEIGRYGKGEGQEGQTMEYAMRARIPADFAVPSGRRAFAMLSQSHAQAHLHDQFPRGWTMFVGVQGRDELKFVYGLEQRPITKTFPAPFGQWWDLRVRVHWSQGSDGWAEVMLGDQLVVPRIRGPNMPTSEAMEWKFGIYRGHNVQSTDSMTVQSVSYTAL